MNEHLYAAWLTVSSFLRHQSALDPDKSPSLVRSQPGPLKQDGTELGKLFSGKVLLIYEKVLNRKSHGHGKKRTHPKVTKKHLVARFLGVGMLELPEFPTASAGKTTSFLMGQFFFKWHNSVTSRTNRGLYLKLLCRNESSTVAKYLRKWGLQLSLLPPGFLQQRRLIHVGFQATSIALALE